MLSSRNSATPSGSSPPCSRTSCAQSRAVARPGCPAASVCSTQRLQVLAERIHDRVLQVLRQILKIDEGGAPRLGGLAHLDLLDLDGLGILQRHLARGLVEDLLMLLAQLVPGLVRDGDVAAPMAHRDAGDRVVENVLHRVRFPVADRQDRALDRAARERLVARRRGHRDRGRAELVEKDRVQRRPGAERHPAEVGGAPGLNPGEADRIGGGRRDRPGVDALPLDLVLVEGLAIGEFLVAVHEVEERLGHHHRVGADRRQLGDVGERKGALVVGREQGRGDVDRATLQGVKLAPDPGDLAGVEPGEAHLAVGLLLDRVGERVHVLADPEVHLGQRCRDDQVRRRHAGTAGQNRHRSHGEPRLPPMRHALCSSLARCRPQPIRTGSCPTLRQCSSGLKSQSTMRTRSKPLHPPETGN